VIIVGDVPDVFSVRTGVESNHRGHEGAAIDAVSMVLLPTSNPFSSRMPYCSAVGSCRETGTTLGVSMTCDTALVICARARREAWRRGKTPTTLAIHPMAALGIVMWRLLSNTVTLRDGWRHSYLPKIVGNRGVAGARLLDELFLPSTESLVSETAELSFYLSHVCYK
jgi:hypothetical protein